MASKELKLSNLSGQKRASRKRLGRGVGSTLGKTSGRGHKGQKSRSGYSRKKSFEGGQMPLARRLPKIGFTNIFRKEFRVISLFRLNKLPENSVVTSQMLLDNKIIPSLKLPVKILGNGNCDKPLTISKIYCTAGAAKKIQSAGGTIQS